MRRRRKRLTPEERYEQLLARRLDRLRRLRREYGRDGMLNRRGLLLLDRAIVSTEADLAAGVA